MLPGSAATAAAARLEVLRGGKDGLMSVREAAQQLGLCTATVYGLCADGALEAFIRARRVGLNQGRELPDRSA